MPSRARGLLVAAFAVALAGCEASRFVIRDVPFCAGDDPFGDYGFVKTNIVLTHADDRHYAMHTLYSTGAGPTPGELGFFNERRMLMVVVACAEHPKYLDAAIVKELSEEVTPSVCPGQEVVFSGWLEAEPSPEAKALGYDGFFHFPSLDLACRAGEVTQANDRTLLQHINRVREAVDAYHARHETLPPDLDTLTRDTMLAELPVDPWGTALRFTNDGGVVLLHAAGPDKQFETADDIEVLRQSPTSSTSIVTFAGVDHGEAADYRAFLRQRGI